MNYFRKFFIKNEKKIINVLKKFSTFHKGGMKTFLKLFINIFSKNTFNITHK